MIDELDDALRDLLIAEMPINGNEVDIAFDQPTRDWASRLSRPTINLFMHDMRENNKLRTEQPYLGVQRSGDAATISLKAVRVDVHYMITAWANDASDEHRLLGRTLMVLYRHHMLPESYLHSDVILDEYDILVKVAQYDQRDIRREIWSMLDNEMRPIIDLTLTIAVQPFDEWSVPLVRSREISFGQTATGFGTNGFAGTTSGLDSFYSVSGQILGIDGVDHLSIQLLELAVPVTVAPNGRYTIQSLRAGTYTVEVWTGDEEPVRHQIEVPSSPEEYDIEL